jgi:phosphoglycerate kinase
MNLRKLSDLTEKDLRGKRVVLRTDFNVPIRGGEIDDDFRLKNALPTLDFLSKNGAKTVILTHVEDIFGDDEGVSSLYPVFDYLKEKYDIIFAGSVAEASELALTLTEGQMLLVENIRFNPEEKENDTDFSMELSKLGELYVNECFSVSHRKHASIVGLPRILPGYAGFRFVEEVENLSKVLDPQHPFLFILGGAKFDTKLPLIKKYLEVADNVYVAGAIANDFFRAMGYEVGGSKVSSGKVEVSDFLSNKKLMMPEDVAAWSNEGVSIKRAENVSPAEIIEDIGPESLKKLAPYIESAKMIVWNGPLGNYEKGFREKTIELAEMIAASNAFSVVGGGDTTAVVSKLKLESVFGFVSTGGGAMLQFLQDGTLPGIEALELTDK